jgi:hypothetical protein
MTPVALVQWGADHRLSLEPKSFHVCPLYFAGIKSNLPEDSS